MIIMADEVVECSKCFTVVSDEDWDYDHNVCKSCIADLIPEEVEEICDRCNVKMRKMTACHLICENCGSHLDCSDKGTVW
jgi:predicted amidophosphoribosyltransferase